MKNALRIGILASLVGYALPLSAATIHVPADQPTIQAGIDAAQPGDTVLVGAGIYKGTGNKNLNFSGKPINVSSASGPANCIIDCENDGRGFLFNSGEQETSVLSGFTITNGSYAAGGAIYCYNSSPTITNCVISGNSASDWGGGICLWGPNSSPLIAECVISKNSAGEGGGISCGASPTVRNCIITRNTSGRVGGGISGGAPIVINSTIAGNSAASGGGISSNNALSKIVNSILWGNSPDSLSPGPIVSYSDVEGGFQGQGNFHGDPLFADSGNDDYHLGVSSPCMDAGTSDGAPATDLDGNPRPQGYGYDLGAYEVTGYDKLRPVIDSFTVDFAEGFIPFEVAFACSAHDTDGEITSYRIDYGDGSAPETNTSGFFAHNYVNKGVAFATCTVTDDSGAETTSFSIIVKRHIEIRVPADYSTIQAAVDAATDGDAVTVADGIYKGIGNRKIDFKGKKITVRSANGAKNCIIDCEKQGPGFYLYSGEGNDSVISGFTITGGLFPDGGGVHCINSSPTISDCIIRGNSSDTSGMYFGGGISLKAHFPKRISPIITNCVIFGNKSGSVGGGGMYLENADAIITNCTIVGNSTNSQFAKTGGGVAVIGSNATITNCIIRGNVPNQMIGNPTCFYSNIESGQIGQGNIDVNAAFADPSINDFRLLDYSPCIGTGTSAGAPAMDIAGNARPSPAGSYPDMGAYESPLAIRTAPPLDIFGMEAGNVSLYEGTSGGNPYTVERKVTMDTSTFPIPTYAYEINENGLFSGREYYQRFSDQVLLWGASIKDEGSLYDLKFSNGLSVIRFPVVVGDHQYSSTTGEFTQFPGYTFNVSMDVLVMAQETVDLGFDTFEAYKVRYEMRVWGQGLDYTDTFYWWIVPYIGAIKDEDAESMVKLTSFAIGGGTISHQTDADRDGLKDYEELIKYKTDWLHGDTDDDGCLDGPELQGGRNPMISDPEGDVNGDCALNIADAISALRVITGIEEIGTSTNKADVNGDGRVGSEEVIWIIQRISGLR